MTSQTFGSLDLYARAAILVDEVEDAIIVILGATQLPPFLLCITQYILQRIHILPNSYIFMCNLGIGQ